LAALQPHLVGPADNRGACFAPDGGERHQRCRVGEEKRTRGGDGEREGSLERIGALRDERFTAARAARLASRRKRRNVLQKIAIRTGNWFQGRLCGLVQRPSTAACGR